VILKILNIKVQRHFNRRLKLVKIESMNRWFETHKL